MSTESHFATLTNWSLWGPFGAAFVLSGFREPSLVCGFLGFALLGAGAVGHLVINRIYGTGFSDGQIAAASGLFVVALLGFLASWILKPDLDPVSVLIGLSGCGLVVVGVFAYLATRYGLKGAFSMFHIKHPA